MGYAPSKDRRSVWLNKMQNNRSRHDIKTQCIVRRDIIVANHTTNKCSRQDNKTHDIVRQNIDTTKYIAKRMLGAIHNMHSEHSGGKGECIANPKAVQHMHYCE
jgi:hypothetical protein